MALALLVHPFGDAAFNALADAVRAGQGGDPLAAVTVVVDRGAVGLAARRRLASLPGGVAGVRFLTWPRLAEDLAASWLAATDRPGRTAAMELEAVRAVLAGGHRGPLASAVDQPATVRALARTCGELAAVPDDALEALARQSARSAEVVAVARAVRERLSPSVSTAELIAAAADAVRTGSGVPGGPVLAYLPERIGSGEAELLDALAGMVPVSILLGSTGDAPADSGVRALAERFGAAVVEGREGAGHGVKAPAPGRTWVRSAPSADAEVLMAVRYLLRRNAQGVPLERMALLHAGLPPYPVLIRDLASVAGLPTHGQGAQPLAATMPGRVLLGALALGDRDWRRDEVAAWLGCGPLRSDGRAVPSTEWDRLSSEAGVVSGLDQWRERLDAYARRLDARADLRDELAEQGADRRAVACQADAARCRELRQFVDGLAVSLSAAPRGWADWGQWAAGFLSELLGGPAGRGRWPQAEIAALDAVLAALGSLAALGWVGGPAPRPGDIRAALAAELDRPAPETTRFGRGILVGALAGAVGLDLDVVCVVGMVDGAFPAASGDDVLVPDRERAAAGPSVPLRGAAHGDGLRAYLAVSAGATERVLSYPRGDQRTGRELRPARLALDALGGLAADARTFHAGDVRLGPPESLPGGSFEFVRSFAEAVQDARGQGEPMSAADWELRSVARWRHDRPNLAGHFLARSDGVLDGALRARRARRARRVTRFDGLVDGIDVGSPTGAVPQSPTGLEAYAHCPRRYLFGTVLGLTERPSPEDVVQLSPAERGVVIHRILERLVAEQLADGRLVAEQLTAGQTAAGQTAAGQTAAGTEDRMLELANAAFAQLEERGVAGHPALWPIDRARILGDLRQFVHDDAAYRSATGAVPVAVEERFGFGDDPGAEVEIGPDRTVRFRGKVDRIDARPGGGLVVVDYKTGSPKGPAGADPLAGGTRLQLPVYGLAAQRRHRTEGPVTAGYWYVGSGKAPDEVPLDAALVSRLGEVVATTVGGIEDGLFPANPGRTDVVADERYGHCRNCPFDRICPADRVVTWARKRDDPSLAAYRRMVEPA